MNGTISRAAMSVLGVGEVFVTKKEIPNKCKLDVGSELVVKIKKKPNQVWYVTEVISVDGKAITEKPSSNVIQQSNLAKNKIKSEKTIKQSSKEIKIQNIKKQKKKNKGKPKDIERNQIKSTSRSITSIPFSSISSEEEITKISNLIETENEIMVTWFRESVSNKPGNLTIQMEEFDNELKLMFSPYNVTVMQWPNQYRSSHDNFRSSHPFISHLCRGSAIIHKNKINIDDQKYKNTLFKTIHNYVIKKSKDRWVIVGDETGSLGEFKGRNDKSLMCWVAIPPNVKLPSLPHDFHCSGNDPKIIKSYSSALNYLQKEINILLFSFEFEQGTTTQGLGKIGSSNHLSFWQDTLPLVLEKISERCNDTVGVDIFVEQVMALESGIGVIDPILNIKRWDNFQFNQLWVISKGEHPWLGYPDALGHVLVKRKNEHLDNHQLLTQNSIFDRVLKSPYRQSSLSKIINPLIANSNSPLFFLKSLHSIDSNDSQDYVKPFLGNCIKKSLESLTPGEWDDLLEHIDINSRDKKGQRATSIIHDFVQIEDTLIRLEGYDNLKFDLLRMMLGTSNHRGAMAEGLKCAALCNSMLIDGFSPTPEKLKKFKILMPGLNDNMFKFRNNHENIPQYDENLTKTEIHELGTIAQSLALTGTIENLEKATEIEEHLCNYGDDRRHKARHTLLLSELLIHQNDLIRANELLSSMEYDAQNSFFFATLLKFAVTQDEFDLRSNFENDMIKLLDENHPSQRIAYWYCRFAKNRGEQNSKYAVECLEHLLKLTNIPLFSHDAPGVILACELMDLESRGYELKLDTTEFYEMVKSNSQPSTLKWLEEHPPNEEDWLAPLNFNYR